MVLNKKRRRMREGVDLSQGGYMVSRKGDMIPVSTHVYASYTHYESTVLLIPMLYHFTNDKRIHKACIDMLALYMDNGGSLYTESVSKIVDSLKTFYTQHKAEIDSAEPLVSYEELNHFLTDAMRDNFLLMRYEDMMGAGLLYTINFRITSTGFRWNDVILDILAKAVNEGKQIDSIVVEYDGSYNDTRTTPKGWSMNFEDFLYNLDRVKFESVQSRKYARLMRLVSSGQIKIKSRFTGRGKKTGRF